jgi:hypothetical protein
MMLIGDGASSIRRAGMSGVAVDRAQPDGDQFFRAVARDRHPIHACTGVIA